MQSFELPEPPKIRQQKPVDRRAYSVVPIRAAADKRIRATAWRVLVSVCSYANRAGLCWPGYDNLAKTHGVTRQAIGRQVRKLISYGYLQKIKNHSWGRSAQILRVMYDEDLSTKQLIESSPFEDKPPGYQWKVLKESREAFNNSSHSETSVEVSLTPERVNDLRLSVEDCVKLWKVSCSAANISRVITSEDLASLQQLQAAGVSFDAFEAAVRRVFED